MEVESQILTRQSETQNTCQAAVVNGSSAVTSLLLVQLTASSIRAHPHPPFSFCACVFQSLWSLQLPSLTRLLMERDIYTHTHSLGGIDLPKWLPRTPPSIALFCGSYRWETWRHPLYPSSCPLHYEGTLAFQCDKPTLPTFLSLPTWHHCTHVPLSSTKAGLQPGEAIGVCVF